MAKIETGVDKLVELVLAKKKISVDAASKELGVSKEVVHEWAEFLEEEKIISVEYSLSKTYLVERKLSKKDVETKAVQYEDKKEAFIRKVDSTLNQLTTDAAGFEEIKNSYNDLKDDIGGEIDQVKHELDELRHYEELKRSMDSEIMKQRVDYEKMVEGVHSKLLAEEQRYKSLTKDIHDQESKLDSRIKEVQDLKDKEKSLQTRLDALKGVVESINTRISGEEKTLTEDQYRLQRLRELSRQIEKELQYKATKELEPLIKASEKHKDKIFKIQETIINKVKDKKDKISTYEKQGDAVLSKFDVFFKKREKTEDMLINLEKQKKDMENELVELKKKAEAYNLLKSNKSIKKHMQELQASYDKFIKKKNIFKQGVAKLKKIISE